MGLSDCNPCERKGSKGWHEESTFVQVGRITFTHASCGLEQVSVPALCFSSWWVLDWMCQSSSWSPVAGRNFLFQCHVQNIFLSRNYSQIPKDNIILVLDVHCRVYSLFLSSPKRKWCTQKKESSMPSKKSNSVQKMLVLCIPPHTHLSNPKNDLYLNF